MAILKSGPLISMSKSVGGLTFYRVDGVQYIRSKSVLPEGYVPTVNQLLTRQLFGLASASIDRVSLLAQMLDLNYSLVNKNATKTYRDVALGFMMRYLCRDSDGKPFSFEVREAMAAALAANPYPFLASMVPLSFQNAVPWPVGSVVTPQGSSLIIQMTAEGWRYWYYQLLEVGYYPIRESTPVVLWGSISWNDHNVGPWQAYPMTDLGSYFSTTIPTTPRNIYDRSILLFQWAYGYKLDPAYYDGLTNLYVVSPMNRTYQVSAAAKVLLALPASAE